MNCRHCGASAGPIVLDLGLQPPANAYVSRIHLDQREIVHPLRLRICDHCWLLQTEDYATAEEVFTSDYAYFSSVSTTWSVHARSYSEMVTGRLGLNRSSHVVEIGSNDGYLLRNFVAAGIPCLGIEPTSSTALAAEARGVPTLRRFFDAALGQELQDAGKGADLVIGNNVYAHVPDINDFTRGIAAVLKRDGVVTLEFPHVLRLLEGVQFDTVYHEHYSYLSLSCVQRIFRACGLRVFDVEQLATHGGSLRVWGCRSDAFHAETPQVAIVLSQERASGVNTVEAYLPLQRQAEASRDGLIRFLTKARASGMKVAGYGAAAKGNTLLNFAGITPETLPYIFDAAPSKQGLFMPGSHIPILPPEKLRTYNPDFVLILPWNLAQEIRSQLGELVGPATRFVTAVPELRIS